MKKMLLVISILMLLYLSACEYSITMNGDTLLKEDDIYIEVVDMRQITDYIPNNTTFVSNDANPSEIEKGFFNIDFINFSCTNILQLDLEPIDFAYSQNENCYYFIYINEAGEKQLARVADGIPVENIDVPLPQNIRSDVKSNLFDSIYISCDDAGNEILYVIHTYGIQYAKLDSEYKFYELAVDAMINGKSFSASPNGEIFCFATTGYKIYLYNSSGTQLNENPYSGGHPIIFGDEIFAVNDNSIVAYNYTTNTARNILELNDYKIRNHVLIHDSAYSLMTAYQNEFIGSSLSDILIIDLESGKIYRLQTPDSWTKSFRRIINFSRQGDQDERNTGDGSLCSQSN